jgi:hypothetical protein
VSPLLGQGDLAVDGEIFYYVAGGMAVAVIAEAGIIWKLIGMLVAVYSDRQAKDAAQIALLATRQAENTEALREVAEALK